MEKNFFIIEKNNYSNLIFKEENLKLNYSLINKTKLTRKDIESSLFFYFSDYLKMFDNLKDDFNEEIEIKYNFSKDNYLNYLFNEDIYL